MAAPVSRAAARTRRPGAGEARGRAASWTRPSPQPSSACSPAWPDRCRVSPPGQTTTGFSGRRASASRRAASSRAGGPTTTMRLISSMVRNRVTARASVVRPLSSTRALLPLPSRVPVPAAATMAPTCPSPPPASPTSRRPPSCPPPSPPTGQLPRPPVSSRKDHIDRLREVGHLHQVHSVRGRSGPSGDDCTGETPTGGLLQAPLQPAHAPHLARQAHLPDDHRVRPQSLLVRVTCEGEREAQIRRRLNHLYPTRDVDEDVFLIQPQP